MINAIATILVLTFFICFVVGMVKPESFKDPNTKTPLSRSQIAKIFLGLFAVSAVVMVATTEPMSDSEKQEIVRQVAAEMNAEPDAKAVITVQDDGAIVVDPILDSKPDPVAEPAPQPVTEVKPIYQDGRSWVMENFVVGQEWSPSDWTKRFGSWEEIPVTDMNPAIIKKYYFESIDMTITVNTLKGEAVTWSSGKK